MSSRIADLLLRAYPAEVRDAYGPDILQLIEDRWRDERGVWQRLRLALDLGADLLVTQVRARRREQPLSPAGGGTGALFAAFGRDIDGGTRLPGMVLSLLMVVAFVRVITPEGDRDLGAMLQTVSEVLRAF